MIDLDHIRHTLSHLLATAVLERFPEAKLAIGPTIEDGFYYDIDLERPLIPQDLPKLEKRMRELIRQKLSMTEVDATSLEQAAPYLASSPYKQELFNALKDQGTQARISFYKIGNFVDLCRGGHVGNTSEIDPEAFKLTKIAGAYWRGDSTKPMLQRIYGVAFATKQELVDYLAMLVEAEKRDHKKLGPQLGLFMFHPTAPGMPYWLPNGMTVYNELLRFWREEHASRGYQEISSPLVNKKELWEQSGHWEHYKDNMFIANMGEHEVYGIKAMNCPNAMVVFGSDLHSYRDLPLRYSDTDALHRYEASGTLNGLLRVRSFRQDDSHNFITEDQIEAEYAEILKIAKRFYGIFKLDYTLRLGTRPEKFMGDRELWDRAEASLRRILDRHSGKSKYLILEGDGAFYGPKVDILMKDSLGREWQMGTIQLDFQLPRRFNLSYTDAQGQKQFPVVIHRVIYGSLERFIGLLIEHTAGRFPTWLAPVQVALIPVGKTHVKACRTLAKEFLAAGMRVVVEDANESVGYKIRQAEKLKVPYMLVIGDKEAKSTKLHVRIRGQKAVSVMAKKSFLQHVTDEIAKRKLSPKS